ncbi:hypothetical protein [Asticcacaulis benevestitus]|nr:hypothetical protein [Asticcacaulis benevestitus]
MKMILGLVLALGLVACSNSGKISGVYVRESDNQLLFVQIVKTDDGKLTGRSETVAILADGSIKDESFPLEGSADGMQLSLKTNVLFGMGPSFSGTISGNALTIVGDGGQAVLKRTTLEKFTRQKNSLSAAAKGIVATKDRAKNEADKQAFLKNLADDGDELETKLPQVFERLHQNVQAVLERTQKRHDAIAGNLKKLRAKRLIASPDDKISIEGDIQSEVGDMQSLASDYDATVSEVRNSYDELEAVVNSFKANCEKASSLGYAPLPVQCADAQSYIAKYKKTRAIVKDQFETAGTGLFPRSQ